jgi:hypothetical protein
VKFITWGERLGLSECPYLRRWVINFYFFSVRLHHWISSDDHRNFHDHPWNFLTIVLRGGYTDISDKGAELLTPGSIRLRKASHAHTVNVNPGGCWTLLLTGRTKRQWGFWVGDRWRKANKYFIKWGHVPCKEV